MRSLLLAVLSVVAVPACTSDITGGGGGGGGNPGSDTGGDTCTCPDGTVMDGNVCATACPAPESGAGTIAIATDLPTYNTQLNQTVAVNVTVTGSQGFSGLVALTAAIKDGDTAITEWTSAFDNAMVSVPMNGTATAKLTITIPAIAIPSTDATKMSEALTITGTPQTTGVTTQTAAAMVVAANMLELDMSATTSTCNFPAKADVKVAVGTTINWKNTGTTNPFTIHVDSNTSGITHQGDPAPDGTVTPSSPSGSTSLTEPGDIWPETVSAIGTGSVTWHCHLPNDGTNQTLTIVMPQ